jgi:hypothetical protein
VSDPRRPTRLRRTDFPEGWVYPPVLGEARRARLRRVEMTTPPSLAMVAAPTPSARGRRGRTAERSQAAFAALLAFLLLGSVVALAFIGTGGLPPGAPPPARSATLALEAGQEVVAVPQEADTETGGEKGGAPAGTSGPASVLLTGGFLSGSDDDTGVGGGSGGGEGVIIGDLPGFTGGGGGQGGGGQGQGGGGGAGDQTGGDTGETVGRETGENVGRETGENVGRETVVVVEDEGTDAAPPARAAAAKPPKPPEPARGGSSEAPHGSSEAPRGKALGHAKKAQSSSGSGATPPGHSKARGAGHAIAPSQGHEKHH